jgi:hypothetical protein
MSDWSSRNGFKPYKPRNDLIVLERGGNLVVRKRWRRKPRQGVQPLPYAVLPPPKPKGITITYTRSTNVKDPPPEWFERPSLLEVIAFALFLKGK